MCRCSFSLWQLLSRSVITWLMAHWEALCIELHQSRLTDHQIIKSSLHSQCEQLLKSGVEKLFKLMSKVFSVLQWTMWLFVLGKYQVSINQKEVIVSKTVSELKVSKAWTDSSNGTNVQEPWYVLRGSLFTWFPVLSNILSNISLFASWMFFA